MSENENIIESANELDEALDWLHTWTCQPDSVGPAAGSIGFAAVILARIEELEHENERQKEIIELTDTSELKTLVSELIEMEKGLVSSYTE